MTTETTNYYAANANISNILQKNDNVQKYMFKLEPGAAASAGLHQETTNPGLLRDTTSSNQASMRSSLTSNLSSDELKNTLIEKLKKFEEKRNNNLDDKSDDELVKLFNEINEIKTQNEGLFLQLFRDQTLTQALTMFNTYALQQPNSNVEGESKSQNGGSVTHKNKQIICESSVHKTKRKVVKKIT